MPTDLDLSYLGLNIDDRDPQAIFDSGLARFQELAPDARPRNGSVEVMLLEAFATASADTIYALNRFSATVVEGVLALYGVPRFAGSPAEGVITLTLDGLRDLTVEAGQRLSDPTTGLNLLVSTTTTGTGVSSLNIPCQTEDAGGEGNSILAGSAVDLLDSIPYVDSAEVLTGFSNGADPESDLAYIDRAATVLARVTSSLVLPLHFTAYALQDTRVGRATAVDLYQPGGVVGEETGHITVFTYGKGAQLSGAVQTELQVDMRTKSAAMVTLHIEPASILTQNITLSVQALAGYVSADIETAVEDALRAWMNPGVWPWGRDIYSSEIIDLVSDILGVDYVNSVTVPATTITVGDSQLALAGTIAVTVTT